MRCAQGCFKDSLLQLKTILTFTGKDDDFDNFFGFFFSQNRKKLKKQLVYLKEMM